MKHARIVWNVLASLTVLCFVTGFAAAAEPFPIKPITLQVGFQPGGGTDLSARGAAAVASKILGQPIVVVNKPGASGGVMLGVLKNEKPDGYNLGILNAGAVLGSLMRKVTYDPLKDFDYIAQYSEYQYGIVVRADSPIKNVKDLIALAKANPGKLKYGSSGIGGPQHLAMIKLAAITGIKWTHIPFGSGNEAVANLMGGHLDFVSNTTEWKPQVDAGNLRLIAITMPSRFPHYPNVPTLIEQGFKVTAPSMVGIVAPKGVPKERLAILEEAFATGFKEAPMQKVLQQFDLPFIYRNGHDFRQFTMQFIDSSREMIKKIND